MRQFTRKGESLLHWSDRSGSRQAYLADLKDGGFRQLTDVQGLQHRMISLSADDKSLWFVDGQTLFDAPLSTLKAREIYQAKGPVRQLAILSDGAAGLLIGNELIRVAPKLPVKAVPLEMEVLSIHARPRHPQFLVTGSDQALLVDAAGSRKPLKLEAGKNEGFAWTPSGKTFTYLHVPEDPRQLITLRENNPEEATDKLLAKTSQFASASANTDASVFTGSSRSKASPYVLILLRVTRRELTLCEHRSSDPASVQSFFAPDSQSVFFQSDRHGKSAIYRVKVEKFVEETEPAG